VRALGDKDHTITGTELILIQAAVCNKMLKDSVAAGTMNKVRRVEVAPHQKRYLSPTRVNLAGSPPKAAMFSLIKWNAKR